MIQRYCTPEMTAIWSERAKLSRWREIENRWVNALVWAGVAPEKARIHSLMVGGQVSEAFVEDCAVREQSVLHDVAAFVDVLQDWTSNHLTRPWIHYGLTGSDIVDTGLGVTMRLSIQAMMREAYELVRVLEQLSVRPGSLISGRTHGQVAEATTWYDKVGHWVTAVGRDYGRLQVLLPTVSVGKLAGPVGTIKDRGQRLFRAEDEVCRALDLRRISGTQVIARDRHAEYLWVCAMIGATVESIALQIRLLAQTEIGEVAEGFEVGVQKGSSSMPHKRNPIGSEQLCGLSRVLRANAGVGLENVALWGERDISHSSAERIVLVDSSQLAHYSLTKLREIIENLELRPERMASNWATYGVNSRAKMEEAIQAGVPREEAYRMVQEGAQ